MSRHRFPDRGTAPAAARRLLSMAKRMLIDTTHPEETRVSVVDGRRLEEFDVEVASKKLLKGNIYLAKITRVEPSLQAAFVEYGGNRHGFLAFSEIHPDYYRIPVEDREALLAEQAALAREEEEQEEQAAQRQRRRGGRSGRGEGGRRAESRDAAPSPEDNGHEDSGHEDGGHEDVAGEFPGTDASSAEIAAEDALTAEGPFEGAEEAPAGEIAPGDAADYLAATAAEEQPEAPAEESRGEVVALRVTGDDNRLTGELFEEPAAEAEPELLPNLPAESLLPGDAV